MTHAPSLSEIAAAVDDAVSRPTRHQQQLLAQVRHQAARLSETAFQLAVLGQFKRGKSTLLNALVGHPLLSAGVLPLTAVPTFLSGGPALQLRLKRLSGEVEQIEVGSYDALAAGIAAATTEEQNPHNEKGLQRVDVTVPSTPWLDDVTLIDTPGIGSTHAHNTDAAYEVLPECDAALFVLSIDPPITEIELQYLDTICRTVSRVIMVLNKVDLVDAADRQKALDFVASVLARRAEPQIDPHIFPLSARRAFEARQRGDDAALQASGLPELEQYVRSHLVDRKRSYLAISIARKMAGILDALVADVAMTVRALTVPLSELDDKIAVFERSATDFLREGRDLEDLLSGEWRRAIARLNELCRDTEQDARRHLERIVAEKAADGPEAARRVIESAMAEVFDKAFSTIAATVDTELTRAIEVHQQRYRDLTGRVRDTAGALLNVSVPPPVPEDWFQIKREPYWVGEARVESLSSLTMDWLARLLPAGLRRRRERNRLREAVANAVTRNISDLRWTMQQNIDDSFRRLLAASSEAVEASIASTRDLLRMAQERRRSADDSLQQDVALAQDAERRLVELRRELDTHLQGAPA